VKRILLALLAFGVTAVAAPAVPASAAFGSDSFTGGCFFDTDEQATATGGRNVGIIGDLSVTTDSNNAPTFATMSCWIEVNGVEAPGTRLSASGTGVQAGIATISFAAGDGDWIAECEQVVYADGTSDWGCPINHGEGQLPPQFVLDALGFVLDTVTAAEIAYVDPAVCPVFVQLAGSYPAGLVIAPDGDVYLPDPFALGINPFWDCPPYRPTS